jgi:hypothetical protein
MNNSNNRNEAETRKLKKLPIEKYYKDKNCISFQLIAIFHFSLNMAGPLR